jgi:hypothetical protein
MARRRERVRKDPMLIYRRFDPSRWLHPVPHIELVIHPYTGDRLDIWIWAEISAIPALMKRVYNT